MKIYILYDNKYQILDVPECDLRDMVEKDLKIRSEKASDGEIILPRLPQEIVDDLYNRPERNNWRKFYRHLTSVPVPYRLQGNYIEPEPMDYIPAPSKNKINETPDYKIQKYRCWLYANLSEKLADTMSGIYLDERSKEEYAESNGISVNTVYSRLYKAKKILRVKLKKYYYNYKKRRYKRGK